MATPKVPALLHKMSVSFQKAWYKKNNMPLPGHLTGAEGKSAAQAKKDVGDINKAKAKRLETIKKASEKVSSDRVREMARRRRESGEGLGGGLETNRDIISHVRAGGTIKAGRLGEETMSLAKQLAQKAMKMQKKTPGADVPADKQIAQQMGEGTIVEHDDEHEYDHEGEMAKTQLKGIIMHAQKLHDSLEDESNLPEWVQAKITMAHDYIQTASDYMQAEQEEDEDLDEETQIDEKYMGFKKLKAAIAAKGGARDPGAVAAAIGRKKYGKAAFQKAAAKDEKMNEALDAVGHEDKDVNNDGKVDKTDGYILNRRAAVAKAIKNKMAKKLGK